jgi:hypothetical protein
MMSLTRLSFRSSRRVSLVVLCCYGTLVLLLTLHHHHHGCVPPGEHIGIPVQAHDSHGHNAADCPLLHYAGVTFQYVPSVSAFTVPLPGQTFHPTLPRAIDSALMAGDQLSRAPPANS